MIGFALADKPFAGAALKWATLAGGTSIEELTEFVKPWEGETGAAIEPVTLPHPVYADFGAAYRFNADVIAIGRFAEMQGGMGSRLIDENLAPRIDSPESVKAMEMIIALAAEGLPDTMAMGFSEYTNTFLLGLSPHRNPSLQISTMVFHFVMPVRHLSARRRIPLA